MSYLLHPKLNDCRCLFLRNYEVQINIGVYEHEKKGTQRVIINVDLFIPLEVSTPKNDLLEEVVEVGVIRRMISASLAQKKHTNLVETLCGDIVAAMLTHPKVRAARVSIEKPDAISDCDSYGIEVFRFKDSSTE